MPIETFQHKNGLGELRGIECAVSSDSMLDKSSFVEGKTFVSYGSSITKNSALKDSHVALGDIQQSILVNSHVSNALVHGSALEGVVVRGSKERSAVVQNCLLSNQTVIESCTVRGFEVAAPLLIHSNWNRAPRHHLLRPCDGVQMAISECSPGGDRGHCGCECRTYAHWVERKEILRKIFTRRGWAYESVDMIHQLFEEWRRIRLAVA